MVKSQSGFHVKITKNARFIIESHRWKEDHHQLSKSDDEASNKHYRYGRPKTTCCCGRR